jgi:hypothetical protein
MVPAGGIEQVAYSEGFNTLRFLWSYNSAKPLNPVVPPKTGTYTAH